MVGCGGKEGVNKGPGNDQDAFYSCTNSLK